MMSYILNFKRCWRKGYQVRHSKPRVESQNSQNSKNWLSGNSTWRSMVSLKVSICLVLLLLPTG